MNTQTNNTIACVHLESYLKGWGVDSPSTIDNPFAHLALALRARVFLSMNPAIVESNFDDLDTIVNKYGIAADIQSLTIELSNYYYNNAPDRMPNSLRTQFKIIKDLPDDIEVLRFQKATPCETALFYLIPLQGSRWTCAMVELYKDTPEGNKRAIDILYRHILKYSVDSSAYSPAVRGLGQLTLGKAQPHRNYDHIYVLTQAALATHGLYSGVAEYIRHGHHAGHKRLCSSFNVEDCTPAELNHIIRTIVRSGHSTGAVNLLTKISSITCLTRIGKELFGAGPGKPLLATPYVGAEYIPFKYVSPAGATKIILGAIFQFTGGSWWLYTKQYAVSKPLGEDTLASYSQFKADLGDFVDKHRPTTHIRHVSRPYTGNVGKRGNKRTAQSIPFSKAYFQNAIHTLTVCPKRPSRNTKVVELGITNHAEQFMAEAGKTRHSQDMLATLMDHLMYGKGYTPEAAAAMRRKLIKQYRSPEGPFYLSHIKGVNFLRYVSYIKGTELPECPLPQNMCANMFLLNNGTWDVIVTYEATTTTAAWGEKRILDYLEARGRATYLSSQKTSRARRKKA